PAVAAARQNQQNPQGQPNQQNQSNPQNPMQPHSAQSQPQQMPQAQAPPVQTQPPARPMLPQLFPLNDGGTMNQPSAPEFPVMAEPPLSSLSLEGQLEKLMQNERNGAAYYRNLAMIAETGSQADILHGIGEGCMERGRSYNGLYRKHKEADFEAAEAQVMGARTFRRGVFTALAEEDSAIRDLIKIYESAPDGDARHVLSAQLYKKFSDLNTLHRLVAEN
ncbi:MAG: hypothetical protein FWE68_05525, partial [Defluviitaleaceae bacterium]|nr:hypothetical protein [Defluviitaleaceae bacterium]